jgi:ligand-binding sensor domain-containing protein
MKWFALFFTIAMCLPLATFSQISSGSIHNIADDGDYLWICQTTQNGRNLLVKYEKATSKWTERLDLDAWACPNPDFDEDKEFVDVQRDKDGNIWLTIYACGIIKFSGEVSSSIQISDSEQTYYNPGHLRIDNDNNKWFYNGNSVLKWAENEGITEWKKVPNLNNVPNPNTQLSSIQLDQNGRMWFTERYGQTSDPQTPLWFFGYFTEDSVQTYYPYTIQTGYFGISGLVIDNDNNKWLADLSHGLLKFNGTNFTVYNTQNSAIPSNAISDIKKDNAGNLWLISGNYLVKFDGSQFSSYEVQNLRTIEPDANGDVWLGTLTTGLYKYDAQTNKVIRPVSTSYGGENLHTAALTVYPNPTEEKLYIQTGNELAPQVKIFDVTGKRLLETQSKEVDLSAFAKGIYMIQVNGTTTTKIVKK